MTEAHPLRWEVEALARPRRTFTEHLMVRFPWLLRRLVRAAVARPAGSRLRRVALTRAMQLGWEANNRNDWASLLSGYSDDVELRIFDSARVAADIKQLYRGKDGLLEAVETWKEGFADHRFEPREIIDPGGDHFGGRYEMIGRGEGSGIEVRQMQWGIWWVRGGMVARQTLFWDEKDFRAALEAAGR